MRQYKGWSYVSLSPLNEIILIRMRLKPDNLIDPQLRPPLKIAQYVKGLTLAMNFVDDVGGSTSYLPLWFTIMTILGREVSHLASLHKRKTIIKL